MCTAESTDEKIVFPLRNILPGIESDTAGGEYWIPVIDGLLKAFFLLNTFAHLVSFIFYTISDGWPTVVFSCHDSIQFVSTARAEFSLPQVTCLWVQC